MSYYQQHKEERLLYQSFYNKTSDNYKAYQQDYFSKNKERLCEYRKRKYYERKQLAIPERKPFPEYKKRMLERMLKNHLKMIQIRELQFKPVVNKVVEKPVAKVVEKPQPPPQPLQPLQPFQGFVKTKTGFLLTF